METLSVLQFIICLMLGMGLGLCGGLLGIGGGLIAIPLLRYLFDMPQAYAQGTALIMIIPNVLLSFIQYKRRNKIDSKKTLLLCAIASVTAFFTANWATSLDTDRLALFFSLFLFVIAFYYLAKTLWFRQKSRVVLPLTFLPLLGILSGITSGLFTVGGALVVVPLLVMLFAYTQTQAQGTALALVVPGGLAALVSYALVGNIAWHIGIPLALGGIVSVSWGVTLAHKLHPGILKLCFSAVLVVVGLLILHKP